MAEDCPGDGPTKPRLRQHRSARNSTRRGAHGVPMSKTLILYTRAGCPLCEEMAQAAGALFVGTGHRLQSVDVDADPLLKARYGWDVPLLFDGELELCRHELNLSAVREWLRLNP